MRATLIAGLALLCAGFWQPAFAAQSARQWLDSFWPTAKSAGITRHTFDRALGNFEPDPDVLKRADSQAEFNMKIWNYLDQMVSDERISEGEAALHQYGSLLAQIEARYGVDRYVVLAIWGMESHYGHIFDNPKLFKNTIRSLATLAWSGGRLAKFGRQQLVAALKIVQRGDIAPNEMTGSWAGAMGHTQFIPTTFEAYGVDFDGDGRRNIWTSVADALGSTAHYLNKSGWHAGETWGYEVTLPASVSPDKSGARSLASWSKLGVRRANGSDFPRPGDSATLYAPNGRDGPAFLLVHNFRVIKRYNSSNFYALAVGHLSDRLRGGGPFVAEWPAHEKPFSLDESKRLQLLLTMKGLYDGAIDGDIGSGSREAIRQFQRSVGLTPDGVETRDLLRRLEGNR
jgi:membrane-bound lytic murein transglycosylase B